MEGWLVPEDNTSSLNVLHSFQKVQSVRCYTDVEHISDASRFEQILLAFFKRFHSKLKIPPFPAMLGDGRPMDLHKLYITVTEKGGFDFVTANKCWALVAKAIGFDSGYGCPLKLIYAKYLSTLERFLWKVPPANNVGVGGYSRSEENLGILMSDSESEVRGLFKEILKQKKKDGILSPFSKRDQFLSPLRQNAPALLLGSSNSVQPNDSSALNLVVVNGNSSSLKRKRESLQDMLNWVKSVATNPIDPSTGNVLPSDGLRDIENVIGVHYSHAFEARKALFLKRIRVEGNDKLKLQVDQKMQPSVLEKPKLTTNPSLQTPRSSQNTHSSDKPSHSGTCSKASTVCAGEKDECHIDTANEASHCRRTPRASLLMPDYLNDSVLQRIPVGPAFQAAVPAWAHEPVTPYNPDDLKWLGIRIWPPEYHEKKLQLTKSSQIGKGRVDGCRCVYPCSAECVRFHIAEERLRLKCELGAAFYAWRFHLMGEEVALSWRAEEEQRFKSTIRLNQQTPHARNLWKQLHLCFPGKGTRRLVSYYFNVFLLARRSYQNRVSPNSIDSDDEEAEFGFLSSALSYGAMRFDDHRFVICAQNLQCVDLGD